MKIGIDGRPLEDEKPSGIGYYLINVLKKLCIDSFNHYFIFVTKNLAKDYHFPENFHVVVIPGKIGTLWVRYKLPMVISKFDIDVFWGTEHILPKLKKKNKVRLVLTVHDIALILHPFWGAFKNSIVQNLFVKKSISNADDIICISEHTKIDIQAHCKSKGKITTIYIGPSIDFTRGVPLRDFIFKFQDKKYFFYIGTIEPRKNLVNLIKAFNCFAMENPNIYLVIAGGKGWKTSAIYREFKSSHFQNRIVFLGYVKQEEKNFLYQHCLGFVFPSFYEGFGMPVLEALYFGKPIITSNISSLPEVAGENAFYCNPYDYYSIAFQMKLVFKLSVSELDDINRENKKRFEFFSWEKCASQTLKILTNYSR